MVKEEVASFYQAFKSNAALDYLDYFSFHDYNSTEDALARINLVRGAVQDQINGKPFAITEYENYKPSDSAATKTNRETSVGAVKFLDHVEMLMRQTDVATVTWNRFMTTGPDGAANAPQPGGLISFAGVKRAIYNAFMLFGMLPVDRSPATLTGLTDGMHALAGSDDHNAGVLVWNDGSAAKTTTISLAGIPAAIRSAGRLQVFRIDAQNASSGDNSGSPELAADAGLTQTVSAATASVSLTVPANGIAYVRLADASGQSLRTRSVLTGAKYIRSWSWAPRVQSGSDWVAEGSYGTFDPTSWILRAGTNSATGQGIGGVTLNNAPATLWVRHLSKNVQYGTDVNTINALRIDYAIGGAYTKSVLFYAGPRPTARTVALPWGKGGTSADQPLDGTGTIGTGKEFPIDLASYAPTGWTGSAQRRILVTAWMQGTGTGAQSVVTLSDKQGG